MSTKEAEKQYLARTGSAVWEQAKPFSHAGADTLQESARLLHDFAAAMLVLRPEPDDLILDLGAGGCWCSDLLGRLNRSSVAVDLSLDMLSAGRSRPNGGVIRAVAGDFESLPFRAGSFQKAVCLDAIHHVPDIPAAVSEIARVLDDDGVALFSEPGRGHANAQHSVAAMRDFGVLEQDILVSDFSRQCLSAGFGDVRVKVLSSPIPAFDVTLGEWELLEQLVKRSLAPGALRRTHRALRMLAGAGADGRLADEALGMSVLRSMHQAVEVHPIIMATKGRPGATRPEAKRSACLAVEMAPHATRGAVVHVSVEATNDGTIWRAASRSGLGHVRLGVQVLERDGRLSVRDYHRVSLPGDVGPGETVSLEFECPAPSEPGHYQLKFDMVAEGVTWFEAAGSSTVSRPLDVS